MNVVLPRALLLRSIFSFLSRQSCALLFFMCHCHRSNQMEKKKMVKKRLERTSEKKRRLLLELEQLPYLHHRPHESTPHSYPQSTCHQFENFNLIKIQWTNDEDDDDEASALEIKPEREKHAFRNFWLLNGRHKNASSVKRAGGGTLSNADLQTAHIFIHFLFTSCIYFFVWYSMASSAPLELCWYFQLQMQGKSNEQKICEITKFTNWR